MRIPPIAVLVLLLALCCSPKSGGQLAPTPTRAVEGFVVVGYATSWDSIMPNPAYLTHINYSFTFIKDDFESLDIENTERLAEIVALKDRYPHLKVLLSLGGWGAGNFSEMAASEEHRRNFCKNCRDALQRYRLDGIDMDWEYPTTSVAGISSSMADKKNFTLLMKDMREALGADRLLTVAAASNARYVDWEDVLPYIDWVNNMSYNMGTPPYHNSPMYRSSMTVQEIGENWDGSVRCFFEKGVPYDKLVMGLPFFGHDANEIINYRDIPFEGLTREWDNIAKVPYLVDASGKMVITYDDPESLQIKLDYILQKRFLGAMYWNIEADDDDWTLSKLVASALLDGNDR